MELTQRQAKEYKQATEKQKGEIITRYCQLTGVSRNLASKRFRSTMRNIHPRVLSEKKRGRKRGRKRKYTNIHKAVVRRCWELSGEICAERLHPDLAIYIDQLEKNDLLKYFGKRYIEETKKVSERTTKRMIADFPKTKEKRSRKGKSDLYKQIPVQAHFGQNADKSGFFEIDYVEHNGGNSSDTFAITGTYLDVGPGWLARSASLGKGIRSVGRIHEKNEKKIHHRVHEYHPDNDRAILSLLLEKFLGEKPPNYSLSRSRPYHKEDNGHVEQKNDDKVRKLVGYHRYDRPAQVEILNKLYKVEDLISNFFVPSQKLVAKVKDEKGRVVKRIHDTAKTPYQRLLEADDVDQEVKDRLTGIYNSLNLVELRRDSERLKQKLFETILAEKE